MSPTVHTLLVATNGAITINRALVKNAPIDTLTDIVPVAMLASVPNVLVINAKLPARTVAEFVAMAKAKPGTINFGSAGPGSTPHLSVALFAKLAGIDMVHVPYRGIAPAITDLVAGNVQAAALGYATVSPYVDAGALRVLAAASPHRLLYLPNVPSADEVAMPRWHVETWYGLFAPRGTPKSIADEINGHILAMLDDPMWRKRYEDNFYDAVRLNASDFCGPREI